MTSPTPDFALRSAPPLRRQGSDHAHTVSDASGLIRPIGIVIGASSKNSDATVVAISDSCEALWGLRPEEILDRPVADFLRWPRLRRVRPEVERLGPFVGTDFRGASWYLTLTLRDDQPMVHLEPVADESDAATTLWLATSSERIQYIDDPIELWHECCENIRGLVGFDRTIVMRYHEADHAEVIAESLGENSSSLLGLRFPAPSAHDASRPEFTEVRSFSMDELDVLPSLIVPRSDSTGRPWDLSLSPLRRGDQSRAKIAQAMGSAASFVLHLTSIDGTSYAIGSQSNTQRRVPPLTRTAAELYVHALHARIDTMRRTTDARRNAELLEVQQRLILRMDSTVESRPLDDSDATTALDIVSADAAIISVDGDRRVFGDLSDDEVSATDAAVRVWLDTLSRHGAIMTDRVRQTHPRLAVAAPGIAGLLAASVGSQGDYMCWVRRPTPRTVTWFDGRTDATRGFVVEPRVEHITDQSSPWGPRDRLAAESLAREMEDSLLRRAQAELAQLALVDVLTGLPNRRLLLDRLEKAIGRASRGHHFALLFLDLNDFKAVNDTWGHQVGDEVLVETARRLENAVRDGDTVARLAGDEFVILCEDLRDGEEQLVAERIRHEFTRPFVITGGETSVGIAIGIGHLELGLDAPSLLDRADRAMYEAKSEMKRD